MKADIKVLSGGGWQYEIDLAQGMYGPRSFWGGVPEINSLVIIGYRRRHKQVYEAVILGYLPVGNKSGLRFDPFSAVAAEDVTPDDVEQFGNLIAPTTRYKRLRLRPGDVGGMAADGAEFALSRDVRMANGAGDLFEIRDADRTIVAQSVHRVEAEAGVHRFSGPIRRGGFWLPPDIFGTDGKTLLKTTDNYFGTKNLQEAGPGITGSSSKFANADGVILDVFNDPTNFPPVTYSNGKRTFYPATNPVVNFEEPELGAGAEAYTEYRLEMYHTTDATPDVLDEIDGFTILPRVTYIEQVLGTTVGNDTYSGMGQRQYGVILKPKVFDTFDQVTPGNFTMEEVDRNPLARDLEVDTMAGAYLFKIRPPFGVNGDFPFGVSVSKQGKLFVQLPGSTVETYADGASKNISAEINTAGAIKAYIGASSPEKVSLNLTLEGGIVADIGSNADGQAITVRYHSSYRAEYTGVPDTDDVAYSTSVTGNMETLCSADHITNVEGAISMTANGGFNILSDRTQINAQAGLSLNTGEMNSTVAGKSQYNYGLAVLENIALGGKISTILAGGLVQTVAAGAIATTAAAGAMADTVGAAYALTAGAAAAFTAGAAMTMTAGAAASVTAGAAVTITAGLSATMTAAVAASLVAPQVLLGGPAAVLGISRGTPMMPPGAPSLDWITGLPLQGCAISRSF